MDEDVAIQLHGEVLQCFNELSTCDFDGFQLISSTERRTN